MHDLDCIYWWGNPLRVKMLGRILLILVSSIVSGRTDGIDYRFVRNYFENRGVQQIAAFGCWNLHGNIYIILTEIYRGIFIKIFDECFFQKGKFDKSFFHKTQIISCNFSPIFPIIGKIICYNSYFANFVYRNYYD